MVFATAPLGLIGVVPTLLLFQQPFGINALVGLIALSGILMRNTLILIGQIRSNEKDGIGALRCRRRGHRAALASGHSDGARRHAGLHSAHPFGVLGNAGVHA